MPEKSDDAQCTEQEANQMLFTPNSLPDPSGLEKEFHFDAGDLDHIVIAERVGLGIERLAVEHREPPALDVWVMKYPCGRRAITATWTPGLPRVVRDLVSSSSRPAFAPLSS